MLHDKDIKKISEIESTFVSKHKKEKVFSEIIDILKIGKHHAIFSSVKQKGISSIILIKILISFAFIDQKNIYSFTIMLSKPVWGVEIKKEVVDDLDAPLLYNEIPVGITPQEHKGSGTPNNDNLTSEARLFLPANRPIQLSGTKNFNKPAMKNPKRRKKAISSINCHNSITKFCIIFFLQKYQIRY